MKSEAEQLRNIAVLVRELGPSMSPGALAAAMERQAKKLDAESTPPDAHPAGKEAEALDVDALAQEIRRVDGKHDLGAGQLAEALMPFLISSANPPTDAGVSEALADAIVNFVADWAPEDDEDTMRRDLEQMFKRFAALSIPAGDGVPPAIRDIAAERKRQIEAEGWSPAHDDAHNKGEMARAAGVYAVIAGSGLTDYRNALARLGFNDILRGLMEHYWPWSPAWFKPTNRRRDLVKAGALIVAEIERLDRLSTASTAGKG